MAKFIGRAIAGLLILGILGLFFWLDKLRFCV
jgi:hypothetical protein